MATTKTIMRRKGAAVKAVAVSEQPASVREALAQLDRLYTTLGRRSPEYREALNAFQRVF